MRKNNQHYLEHLCIRKFKNPNNLTRLSFYEQNIFWVSSLENFIQKYRKIPRHVHISKTTAVI